MNEIPPSKSRRLGRPDGIVPALHQRSKARRITQKQLTAIGASAGRRNDLLPDLRIEYLSPTELRPALRRVRSHDPIQAARLDRSIIEFGMCSPIIINQDRRIIHGHGMWEAAQRAGLTHIPTITADHLTAGQQRLLGIALNRLGETAVWDEAVLAEELGELLELDEDVLVTGFELTEIDALLLLDSEEEHAGAETDEDALPELGERTVSRPGDLWRLGNHLLLQGDALDAGSYQCLFPNGELARIVLTDEPFNVRIAGNVTGKKHHAEFAMASGEFSREEFFAFNRTWMHHCAEMLITGGLIGTFIDWRSVEIVLAAGRELGLDLLNIIVWEKTNGGQGSLWRSQHELLPIFKKGASPHINNVQLGRFGRWRSNVWPYPGGSSVGSDAQTHSNDHPTVKPRAMLEDALLDVSNRGEIVLDPFVGSGSTLLAAETTGRVCRAIEIDSRYCDLIIARWQALTGDAAVLAETGEVFVELAERRTAEEPTGPGSGCSEESADASQD